MTTHPAWLFMPCERKDAARNMAIDEALLEAMPVLRRPVLRFYGWTQEAASFGYFQRYADVEVLTALRPLVRRPTGGGIVPHDCDWTYSAAFPVGHEWFELRAEESYRRVHEWIQAAFQRIGLDTTVAPQAQKTLPGQCFLGHERFDLLHGGRKIAGAAQRRSKSGLLIQGSVQPPDPMLSRDVWEKAMLEASGQEWSQLEWSPALCEKAESLAATKFGTEAFLRKR